MGRFNIVSVHNSPTNSIWGPLGFLYAGMTRLPSGTVTFLFTDLEDSTRLWERHAATMRDALVQHDAIMQAAIADHGGVLVKHTGDGVHAVFAEALGAANACVAAQHALQQQTFGPIALRSRMAIYTGAAELQGSDYRGPVLNRAARLMAAGHGGQILVAQSTRAELHGRLPTGTHLRDLGVRRLKDVPELEQVFQLVAEGLVADFPPLRTIDVRPSNLPAPATAFIGRERDVSTLVENFRNGGARLVTLLGVGGSGKSRLAIEIARNLIDAYADGVVYVPLSATATVAGVHHAVAQALLLRPTGGTDLARELCAFVSGRQLLLVLDNFEQVVDAALLVSALLESSARLHVLVTSRETLRISGERIYPVEPLALPNLRDLPAPGELARVESVALFLARSLAANPELHLNADNAVEIAQICCRLEGLPLAIELAAARTRILPLSRMLLELDDRLRFLTGGPRNEPSRHRTLRATIDWSHERLNASEQSLFRRLGVFVDGATLEAVEAVCGVADATDIVATLESLVAKSLVRHSMDNGVARFLMLETLHDYARERLAVAADAEAIAAAHAEYFARLAETLAVRMNSPEQGDLLRRLDAEAENIRAALQYAASGSQPAAGLRLCKALHHYWSTRGLLTEGRAWCARMLEASKDEPADANRIATAHTLAVLAMTQNDYDVARPLLARCAAEWRELGDLLRVSRALNNLGIVLENLGELAAARSTYEESLAIKREIGDRSHFSLTMGNLANVVAAEGDLAQARSLLEQAVAHERAQGGQHNLAIGLCNLGGVMRQARDFPAARRACEEGVAILRRLNARGTLATVLEEMGNLANDEGATDAARAAYVESLTIAVEIGERRAIAAALEGLAMIAIAMQQGDQAAHNLGAASRIRAEIRTPHLADARVRIEAGIAQARALAGEAGFERAWQSGVAAPLKAAAASALDAATREMS